MLQLENVFISPHNKKRASVSLLFYVRERNFRRDEFISNREIYSFHILKGMHLNRHSVYIKLKILYVVS